MCNNPNAEVRIEGWTYQGTKLSEEKTQYICLNQTLEQYLHEHKGLVFVTRVSIIDHGKRPVFDYYPLMSLPD